MKTIYSLAIFSVIIFPPLSHAEEKSKTFTAYGSGLISCGKYTSYPKGSSAHETANQWVLGFVTAKNESLYFENPTREATYLDGLDYHAITKYVSNYCEANPLDPIYAAANKLIYDLSERAIR